MSNGGLPSQAGEAGPKCPDLSITRPRPQMASKTKNTTSALIIQFSSVGIGFDGLQRRVLRGRYDHLRVRLYGDLQRLPRTTDDWASDLPLAVLEAVQLARHSANRARARSIIFSSRSSNTTRRPPCAPRRAARKASRSPDLQVPGPETRSEPRGWPARLTARLRPAPGSSVPSRAPGLERPPRCAANILHDLIFRLLPRPGFPSDLRSLVAAAIQKSYLRG